MGEHCQFGDYSGDNTSKILSGLVQKYVEKQDTYAIRNLERLEMAHIRLEVCACRKSFARDGTLET